jgi:uncharacterized membrane protein
MGAFDRTGRITCAHRDVNVDIRDVVNSTEMGMVERPFWGIQDVLIVNLLRGFTVCTITSAGTITITY